MESFTANDLPFELREENHYYPPELFEDWGKKNWTKKQKKLQYDGGDPIAAPVTNSERVVLAASYAVLEALNLPCNEKRLAKIARCDIESSFITSIRKVRYNLYDSYDGLEGGDVELAAEELGVYELIWPFDSEKLQTAKETEQQILSGIA